MPNGTMCPRGFKIWATKTRTVRFDSPKGFNANTDSTYLPTAHTKFQANRKFSHVF